MDHPPFHVRGIRRIDEARHVEVVGDRYRRIPRTEKHDLDVVVAGHRPVGVGDHVLKDGHQGGQFFVGGFLMDHPPFHVLPAEPFGQQVFVFNQEPIPRDGLAFGIDVGIGDTDQPNAKAVLGEQVIGFVDQVFLQGELLVGFVFILAMRDQLQFILPGKHHVGDGFLFEVEAQRRHVAVEIFPPVEAARLEADLEQG